MSYTTPKTQKLGLLFGLMAFLITSLFTLSLQAQSADKKAKEEATYTYAVVNYMKSKPGKDPVALEMKVWKPLHQQLIKSGKRTGWDIFTIAFPSGTGAEYDYITVDYFQGMENMELTSADMEKAFQAAHPGKDWATLGGDETEASRDMVRREIYVWRAGTEGEIKEMPKAFDMHKMSVAPMKMEEYIKMETELAKPLHQATVDAGMMTTWSCWQMIFPGGSAQGHNFVTGEGYTSMKAMEKDKTSDWSKTFKKVHPDKDMEETIAYIMDLREEVSSELWMLEESVRASAPTAAATDK